MAEGEGPEADSVTKHHCGCLFGMHGRYLFRYKSLLLKRRIDIPARPFKVK
jgi:hypothetical protein